MKKGIAIVSVLVGMLLSAHIMTAYAAEPEPMIEYVESNEEKASAAFATVNVSVADSVELPLTVQMENSMGVVTMEIKENGDEFQIIPTTYRIKSARSVSGKEYPSGASLRIAEEGGAVFLDFTKPESAKEGLPIGVSVLIVNAVFLAIAFAAFAVFTWYREHLT